MSGSAREKDQADFDLERFVDLFDEAMTSKDPRVMKTLRDLMMIVALTCPESRDSGLHDRNAGPLRRLFEDVNHLNRRVHDVEDVVRRALSPREESAYQAEAYQAKIAMEASYNLAQHIDQTVINQLKVKPKGLYHK